MNELGVAVDLLAGDLVRTLPRAVAAPVGLGSIAESYFGYRCFGRGVWDLKHGEMRRYRLGPHVHIDVLKSLPLPRARWKMALGFAEQVLVDLAEEADAVRRQRAALAAALLIPRSQLRTLRKVVEVADMAHELAVPRAAVLLRHAEVEGIPTALVHPHYVRRRGTPSELLAGDPDALRAFAASRVAHRSVLKVRCDDEPQQAVVMQVRA